MKKLVAVMLMSALTVGAISAPAWGAEGASRSPDAARAAGKVKSINGNTFMLATPKQGEIKVRHDGKTEWKNGNASDLKVGSMVGAAGTKTGDVLHAAKVIYNKQGPRRKARHHIIRGEITKVSSGSFEMKTQRGPVTVKFGEDTRYKGGDQSNLKVGAKIGVVPQGCAKKPEVNADKARAGGQVGTRKGAHARLCIDASKPGAKASAGAATADGGRKAVSANTAPRTINARAILFPRTAP